MIHGSPATAPSAKSLRTQERLVHVGPPSIGTVGTGRRDDNLRQSAAYSLVQLVHSIFKKIGRNEEAHLALRLRTPSQSRLQFLFFAWTSRSRTHVAVNIHNSQRHPRGPRLDRGRSYSAVSLSRETATPNTRSHHLQWRD
jgi:hypothetical protein